ncbi:hypothetical protein MIR68_004226 [Amoeboaphelidium protococcarum]|nr:hypothetical protein MIR68_004226 [Amoeboaphelidium protococcarum]
MTNKIKFSKLQKKFLLIQWPDWGVQQDLKLFIRGRDGDEAVICTHNETFKVAEQQSSNTMLVVQGDRVIESVASHLELTRIRPSMERVQELIKVHVYQGQLRQGLGISAKELLQQVQCSHQELLYELSPAKYICLDGLYMVMSLQYTAEVVENLIAEMNANGFDMFHFDLQLILQAYQVDDNSTPIDDQQSDYPAPVVKYALLSICDCNSEGSYAISRIKIAKLLCQVILSDCRQMELSVFLQKMQFALDTILGADTEPFDINAVRDCVIINQNGDNQRVIVELFPLSELSGTPVVRFRELFDRKASWMHEELLPFIKDLAPTEKDLNNLLPKFTKSYTDPSMPSKKFYKSRR